MIRQEAVEIVTAQMIVAAARPHLVDAAADLHHGDVEGTASEVVDEDALGRIVMVCGQTGAAPSFRPARGSTLRATSRS